MLKTELLEIIANGENSGVEFKRDDIRPEQRNQTSEVFKTSEVFFTLNFYFIC